MIDIEHEEGVKTNEVNAIQTSANLAEMIRRDVKCVIVGYETDEHGNIIRFIFYTENEQTANRIKAVADDNQKYLEDYKMTIGICIKHIMKLEI